jgi:hypothetical protein
MKKNLAQSLSQKMHFLGHAFLKKNKETVLEIFFLNKKVFLIKKVLIFYAKKDVVLEKLLFRDKM